MLPKSDGDYSRQVNQHSVGISNGRPARQNSPKTENLAQTPYNSLTLAGIKFGYFESVVVLSSDQYKENDTGGITSGIPA